MTEFKAEFERRVGGREGGIGSREMYNSGKLKFFNELNTNGSTGTPNLKVVHFVIVDQVSITSQMIGVFRCTHA